jgi:hypothetical protein
MRLGRAPANAVIVNECRVAVTPKEQVPPKVGIQADWINVEIGQVHEMDPIGQPKMIALWLGIERLPQTQPALSATFGGKHGVSPFSKLTVFLTITES